MLSIGGMFCVAELLFMNFVLLFFGFGFILVGFLNFIVPFSWEWQLLSAFVLSFILIFVFKKPLNRAFHRTSGEYKDNFLDESGFGEIKNGMVYFKGTFWQSDEIDELIKNGAKEGDKVKVLGSSNGKIRVEKE